MPKESSDGTPGELPAAMRSASAKRAALGLALSRRPDDIGIIQRMIAACEDALASVTDPGTKTMPLATEAPGPVSQTTLDRFIRLARLRPGPGLGFR